MKIALLGAPGSGKTKFARELAKRVDDLGPFKLVDNYVPKLEKRTGLSFGHFATYVPNLMVATERIAAEEAAGPNTITCGTIFESIAYTALHSSVASQKAPAQRLERARAEATLQAMGMLVADTFNYKYAFYLPYKRKREGWNQTLNDLLPTVWGEFFYYISRLDLTFEKNLDLAETVIREMEKEDSESVENQVTPDEQPAVRTSEQAGPPGGEEA